MSSYRLPHNLPFDARLAVVAQKAGMTRAEILALWVFACDHASQNKPRGSVQGFDAEVAGVTLEIDHPKILAALKILDEKKLVAEGMIAGWDKQQMLSSKRVRAYRARKKKAALASPPPLPKPVTPAKPPQFPRTNPDTVEAVQQRRERLQKELMAKHNPTHQTSPYKENSPK